ncbi:MAG: 3-hydroxyacyl-CoA dehydrogenase NAD-binding domain-containing protein [Gammaproteobacteria bacterium]|nr:3-hydroxyacyl-CoA dehydrogenase NAD-binding domain-containing protein [Gammaproteobacteria bacterium]MDH5240283.1 3-hydroxyacyl-CoA dehydrogenase NAD-binding domain-containing protein [Gammaproteobacteria bacterium]MDH5260858.1 3-hydroxyacyl-CoA dehydrogenase NAD-binding domain-containing protein [Gammaproteobacteria bacterium]MDH5583288.1 3-hydroxyacyl-CoA dehydrogenase NAD-binding domain-containing protein [Gammaproteobacteria bacterium]
MSSPVRYELKGNIGVITVNNPPVNALSHAVRQGLLDAINTAQRDASEAVLICCEGNTFIAGADITEFGKPFKAPGLPDVLDSIEASKKPVVAALHGTALGGGFETALAAHYRCAVPAAKVGFPEVNLGLLPGAGGTQRTPRLAGIKASLDLITSGAPISAAQAVDIGLIDEIIEGDLRSGALVWAKSLVASGAQVRRTSELPAPQHDASIFDGYRAAIARRARGQIAQEHIVTAVEAATTMSYQEGVLVERKAFMDCLNSPQSAGMRHIFFAERQASKVDDLPKDTPLRPVRNVGVIGGGTMGGGIAMSFANAGIAVTMIEISDEALQRGLGIIEKNYEGSVKRGKLSEDDAANCRSLISGSTDYADLADVDLVVEAVFEDPELKKTIFRKLDGVCKPGAILATNTSYQDVDAIAAVTKRPEDVLGMHFFSPAHIMKLLEVVRGAKTSDAVLATVMALAKKIRKVAVVSGVCYGFIGNRMLNPYGKTVQLLLLEGASPQQIDTAMENWGMAMGPLRVFDLAGLDVGYKARQALPDDQKGDPKSYRVPDLLVEAGRLGQKSGAGFYTYDENRAPTPDPAVDKVILAAAKEFGIARRSISDEEIVDRLIASLVDEGRKILDEGIAQRSSDIDVVYVYGYGFPASRGGPMFYAGQK